MISQERYSIWNKQEIVHLALHRQHEAIFFNCLPTPMATQGKRRHSNVPLQKRLTCWHFQVRAWTPCKKSLSPLKCMRSEEKSIAIWASHSGPFPIWNLRNSRCRQQIPSHHVGTP